MIRPSIGARVPGGVLIAADKSEETVERGGVEQEKEIRSLSEPPSPAAGSGQGKESPYRNARTDYAVKDAFPEQKEGGGH